VAASSRNPARPRRARASGPAFTVSGVPIEADAAAIEAGIDVAVSERLTLDLSYSGEIGHTPRTMASRPAPTGSSDQKAGRGRRLSLSAPSFRLCGDAMQEAAIFAMGVRLLYAA
jgi:hypothetical protein